MNRFYRINAKNQQAKKQLLKAKLQLVIQSDKKQLPEQAIRYVQMAHSQISTVSFKSPCDLLMAIEIEHQLGFQFTDAKKTLSALSDITQKNSKFNVFISYSRDDFDVAEDIFSFLIGAGFNLWMDKFSLVPGNDWKLEIHNNIRSSDFFIACLSKNSVSKRGYIQKELKEAISVLDEMPEGEIFIIPIRIDDCLVPQSLADWQWLDWSDFIAKHRSEEP